MTGVCSAHQGHDPGCRLCNLKMKEEIADKLTIKKKPKNKPVDTSGATARSTHNVTC